MKMQEITENGGMNIRSSIGRVALVATAFAALTAAFSASAITQAEWEADNSLIPDPASGAFYVVSPAARTGEQTVDADMDGLDATPTERSYDFPFGTSLSTCKPGFIVVIK